jgi:hypothetical protein
VAAGGARAAAGKDPRIGFLGNSTAALEANLVGPFRKGLRDLGYEERLVKRSGHSRKTEELSLTMARSSLDDAVPLLTGDPSTTYRRSRKRQGRTVEGTRST